MQIGVALEEMGLPYEPHTINIGKQETYTEEFKALNPNSKIPVIVDPDGPDGKPITIFESGAILLYLAEKSGRFLSKDPHHKWETIQWLMFQMAGVGPMFGQYGHFVRFAKDKCDHPYPADRYGNEAKRLLGVIESRLQGREFLVDNGYSIADMATFPWIRYARNVYEEKLEFHRFPNTSAWVDRCYARPASAKGTTICELPH